MSRDVFSLHLGLPITIFLALNEQDSCKLLSLKTTEKYCTLYLDE